MPFDPISAREFVLGPLGIERNLGAGITEVREHGAFLGYADSFITNAIKCLLVGLDEPAYNLLERASDWVKIAIDEDVRTKLYSPFFEEYQRFEYFALCSWLLEGKHDVGSLHQAADFHDRYFEFEPQARRDKVAVDMSLPLYLESGQCDRVIGLLESTPGMKPPEKLTQVRTEGRMAYVICVQRVRATYQLAEIQECTRRFLSRYVPRSLNEGLYHDVARWMKLAHWDGAESRESARNALLHCYDYLPFPRPSKGDSLAANPQ